MNLQTSARKAPFAVQWFVHLCVIFQCVGTGVPGINESHYLPKAKHQWDAEYAPGDLFLSSHDSHFACTTFAGLLARVLPLVAVAWFGRILSWCLFSWAWLRFSQALKIPAVLSPIALAAWLLAIQHGHWAGEWVIGGFEAKSIAYPFVLFAIAAALQDRWRSVWIYAAIAVAWHPVAGGWAGLTLGFAWLFEVWRGNASVKEQIPWLCAGVAIGSIGILPALAGIGGEDRVGKVVASQVHVYYRLSHHMSPRTFATERHYAALASLAALALAGLFARWVTKKRGETDENSAIVAKSQRVLQAIAWGSVGIATVGLAIDLTLSVYNPSLASKLLRFYWFRWSDAMVPLAATSLFWGASLQIVELAKSSGQWGNAIARVPLLGGSILTVGLLAYAVFDNWEDTIPPADKMLVNTPGIHEVESDRYVDWLAVCEWIRENTPEDSLWLTPRHQQSFKWHAARAEVVCWKDVPQDNASVLEWYSRIQICEPPHYVRGGLAPWNNNRLRALQRKYGFQWLLVDRTIQPNPLLFELAYPIGIENRSFAVFKFP